MTKFLKSMIVLAAVAGVAPGAMAHKVSDLAVTDGMGEGMMIKHGFLGIGKTTEAQDRLGDGFIKKNGLFEQESGANLLGNKFMKKKGLIGGTQLQASDILGDRMSSHKTWFGLGRRQTEMNLSGVSGVMQSLVGHKFSSGGPTGAPLGLVDTKSFSNANMRGRPDLSSGQPAQPSQDVPAP